MKATVVMLTTTATRLTVGIEKIKKGSAVGAVIIQAQNEQASLKIPQYGRFGLGPFGR